MMIIFLLLMMIIIALFRTASVIIYLDTAKTVLKRRLVPRGHTPQIIAHSAVKD